MTDPAPARRWRNDINPKESPSVETVVIYAEDSIKINSASRTELYICHVKALHGGTPRNAFMPSVRMIMSGYLIENGGCIIGEGDDAYERAVTVGEEILAKS